MTTNKDIYASPIVNIAPVNLITDCPLHLSYAQLHLLLEARNNPTATFFDSLRRKLGGFKVAEALVEKGVFEKLTHSYALTPKGREVFNLIQANKEQTPAAIIRMVEERFHRD